MIKMIEIIILICCYLIGSMPCGLILTKLLKLPDLRSSGSGNIGATNALRVGGKKLGILTLLLDGSKGIIAYLLAKYYLDNQLILIGCLLAVIGHIFPIWLNFKGGKGVATSLALVIVINWQIGIIVISLWLVTIMISKISSFASIVSFAALPLITYLIDKQLLISSLTIASLIIIKHHTNIKRLINNQEQKIFR